MEYTQKIQKVSVLGAAGKMGMRITRRLKETTRYQTLYVESGKAGNERLQANGCEPSSLEKATPQADVVILAVTDMVLGSDMAPFQGCVGISLA